MTRIVFAKAFRRHVECPDDDVSVAAPATLRAALDAYFAAHPAVRGYVVDETGRVRRHVTVFVDGEQVSHADALDAPVGAGSTVHVFQALSGG